MCYILLLPRVGVVMASVVVGGREAVAGSRGLRPRGFFLFLGEGKAMETNAEKDKALASQGGQVGPVGLNGKLAEDGQGEYNANQITVNLPFSPTGPT